MTPRGFLRSTARRGIHFLRFKRPICLIDALITRNFEFPIWTRSLILIDVVGLVLVVVVVITSDVIQHHCGESLDISQIRQLASLVDDVVRRHHRD